uniref:Uncharacterized protein n=1 Tax=Lactuca sativa TaxID=4236 RepID=A0A9R1X1X3_LACSA|nr:hypothetical protein LSAT_V11C700387710 [Lactuca sativa]
MKRRYYSIVEYSATWACEFFSIPHESYWPVTTIQRMLLNSELKRKEKCRPRSIRLQNGINIKEGKKIFVESVGSLVIIRIHVLPNQEKDLLIHNCVYSSRIS